MRIFSAILLATGAATPALAGSTVVPTDSGGESGLIIGALVVFGLIMLLNGSSGSSVGSNTVSSTKSPKPGDVEGKPKGKVLMKF